MSTTAIKMIILDCSFNEDYHHTNHISHTVIVIFLPNEILQIESRW
jgi:hypothetical protein